MPKLDVLREIHTPGLDLHPERMNMHRIFMDIIHENLRLVAALGWSQFQKQGRGALFVSKHQWMMAVRGTVDGLEFLPFGYLTEGTAPVNLNIDSLGLGYAEMLRTYDPEEQLVLLVNHHPGEVISVYLLEPVPHPPDAHAYAALKQGARRRRSRQHRARR